MSTTTASAAPSSPPESSARPGGLSPVARRLLIWGGAIFALMLLLTYLSVITGSSTRALDPDNSGSDGMQALARVLTDTGVQVEVVRGVSALPERSATGATVLIAGTNLLAQESGRDLLAHTRDAESVVILSPADNLSDTLGIDAAVYEATTPTPMSPECDIALWNDGEQVTRGDRRIRVDDAIPRNRATTCLPPSANFNIGGARDGHLVRMDASGGQPVTYLAGIGSALSNEYIGEHTNAATGLRLLGASERLVWVLPSISDAGDTPPQGLFDVLPDAAAPSVALFVAALVMLALVQGRRLGRVSTEPLPVVIRSIETTASRGRLYREANDRDRALASLQLAARQRLTARLRLPAAAASAAVVSAVAQESGRHTEEVRRLIADPSADDDDTLVQIARDVRSLEEGIGDR